jgi:crossover junction endodeoxyribonuclease RusA
VARKKTIVRPPAAGGRFPGNDQPANKPVKLSLPYPPSVNTYWRQFRGRAILSADGRAYRLAVYAAVWSAGRPRIDGRLAVTLEVWTPDRMRRDLDNLPKGILDGLAKAGVYADDSQIDRLTIERMGRAPHGRVDVLIDRLDGKVSGSFFDRGLETDI